MRGDEKESREGQRGGDFVDGDAELRVAFAVAAHIYMYIFAYINARRRFNERSFILSCFR